MKKRQNGRFFTISFCLKQSTDHALADARASAQGLVGPGCYRYILFERAVDLQIHLRFSRDEVRPIASAAVDITAQPGGI